MNPVPPIARSREPIFTMPAVVIASIAILIGIHAVRQLLSDISNLGLILDLGFVPARLSSALGTADPTAIVAAAANGEGEAAELGGAFARYVLGDPGLHPWSVLSYAFLHGSWMHVGLNSVWLAAFATPVVRRCGTLRALLLAAVTSLCGALAHWLAHPLGVQPMIGASAIVSGLMGAAATFAFERPGYDGEPEVAVRGVARIWHGLRRVVANRTALFFLGSWFVMNLAIGVLAQPLGISDASIAWEAHVGGIVAGLILFPLLDPGPSAWQRWPYGV